MFVKNIKCTKCGRYYDAYMDMCPHCLEKCQTNENQSIPKNIVMLPPIKQALLFASGLVAFFIFSTIFALVFSAFFPKQLNIPVEILLSNIDEYPQLSFSINITTYILLFIVLICLLIPNYKIIFKHFKNKTGYLYALFFAIVLIGVNILLSLFLNLLNVEPGQNQKELTDIIQVSPVVTILIFGIIGPICEEITYRLGLFSFLQRTGKIWLAYLISILIFGLIHFKFTNSNLLNELINLPSYLIGGLILTIAYHKGGLQASIIAHVLNNVLSISLIISGI